MDMQMQLPTNTWVVANWDEYIEAMKNPAYEKAKSYYYNGQLRIEMTPIGPDHSRNSTIIIVAVSLFGIVKGIALNGLDNCSYQKTGVRQCQPDVSYYVGDRASLVPQGTAVVDLDYYLPPDLVIEIANTSLSDDLGSKRLLYEELGVAEYWVVDVQRAQMMAFAIADGGSRRITESQVLPGLAMSLLEEALRRSREVDQTQVGAWLMQQFQL